MRSLNKFIQDRIMSALNGVLLNILLSCILLPVHHFKVLYANTTTFTISNSCGYTIWPGLLSNAGVATLAEGGFTLASGASTSVQPPPGWSGRIWGRTGCTFNSGGVGSCATGDCGGLLQCQGVGGAAPVTLVEFTLQGTAGATQDYYDVSLVDGYNVPVAVTPSGETSGTCGEASCSANINSICPASLQVLGEDEDVVSCKSACLAFETAAYCCSGAYANPSTCSPSSYSKLFKAACPSAYSYAYDDPTSTFTCSASQYLITFCPSSSATSASEKTSSTNNETSTSSGSGASATTLWSQAWNGNADHAMAQALMWRLLICWLVAIVFASCL